MDSHGWLSKATSRGAGGMHHIPWFCTSEAVESEINVAQHLAKKGDIYYYDMDMLLVTRRRKDESCQASTM